MADTVPDLAVGDTVYWDDRPGWQGMIVNLPSATTLDVDYYDDNDGRSNPYVHDIDRNIDRRMFTVRR